MARDDKTKHFPCALAVLAAGLAPGAALAQSAAPGAVIVLDEIQLRADTTALRFKATPGAVARIDRSEATGQAAPTLANTLSGQPGVVIQQFFGGNDQPRIQIRGSGLQQNPAERGLLILQDGMPVNRADGAYVVGLAAPGQAEDIEIFRGGSANRIGANVLGGAINFASPSGASAPGTRLSFGGGSFGRGDVAGSYGIDGQNADVLLRFEHSQKDGYREYNSSRRTAAVLQPYRPGIRRGRAADLGRDPERFAQQPCRSGDQHRRRCPDAGGTGAERAARPPVSGHPPDAGRRAQHLRGWREYL